MISLIHDARIAFARYEIALFAAMIYRPVDSEVGCTSLGEMTDTDRESQEIRRGCTLESKAFGVAQSEPPCVFRG